jgi:hypothetical protein
MTRPVRNLSVNIERPFETVADYLGEPRNFPAWATGLSSGLELAGGESEAEPGEWIADAPEGQAFVRFGPPNEFGVADHRVRFPDGQTIDIPLRAIRNGTGTTVVFTLLRQPGMDDARFDVDSDWVRRDLEALKALLER